MELPSTGSEISGEPPAISVSNLTKTFGPVTAVSHISFSVSRGEVLGILGPNGAGKTTTIRMITGILPLTPDSSVRINAREFRENPGWCKTQFGIVPEESNSFMDFTVSQNLEFSGRVYGLSRGQVRARGQVLLEEFDLTAKKDAVTKTLSKGQKQRLSFCRALLHDPPILILDEPTSGLDPLSIRLLRDRIDDLRGRGKTILLTTHDLREAEKSCDRVLIMVRGRVIKDETPQALHEKYGGEKTVQFKPGTPISPDVLVRLVKDLGGREIVPLKETGYLKFVTDNALRDLAKLNGFSEAVHVPVSDVKLEESTLEDVFIHLVTQEEESRE